MEQGRQVKKVMAPGSGPAKGWELVIPNPKLKLMDQVREVLRVKHYAIRTEQAYCDWIKRGSWARVNSSAGAAMDPGWRGRRLSTSAAVER